MNGQLQATQQVVFMREKGRVTIPAPVRKKYDIEEGAELILSEESDRLVLYINKERYVESLLDQIGSALSDRGITLNELLEDGQEIRLEIFKETYPELAEKYDL